MPTTARERFDLFLISLLVLFLELACIRWFPSHVLFLTFFTNTVLLASVLGMSVGCLAAGRRENFLPWTPLLLIVALGAAHVVEFERQRSGSFVDVGNQTSPQLVFFGAEYQTRDPSTFVIPIEVICGLFFLAIALAMIGPGQQLGRSLSRIQNRLGSYTLNILGSIAGIVLFAVCSWFELPPVWWFAIVLAGIGYFLMPQDHLKGITMAVGPALVLFLAATGGSRYGFQAQNSMQELWSPYYRIHYEPEPKVITVNLIGHQQMVSRQSPFPAYSLPHLFNRDAGRAPFGQVLIIGAGSGNDVSRALAWGAERVDAVEIDPVIYRLGRQHHPDHPYDDPRVFVHLNDGRNYLKSSNKQYDLIVYALVDSLVLHSSYSNIRLESYLFTKQAMDDVRQRLRPGGIFVMYNYFRQGWIVSRLQNALESSFGAGKTMVMNLPPHETLQPDQLLHDEFTVLLAGAIEPIRDAFARQPEYWLKADRSPDPQTPNGFETPTADERAAWRKLTHDEQNQQRWTQFRTTRVVAGNEPALLATDDWPFLYLRTPMIPGLSLRGMGIMGVIGLLLVLPFLRRTKDAIQSGAPGDSPRALLQMFFLGAGFMLVETKAVVHMALLFGGTWVVNSIVIFAVLVMILLANIFVLVMRPQRLAPYYVGLLLSLTASALVPMDYFLGMDRTTQIVGSSLLAFVPVLFAGVIFAVSFARSIEPDRAFGANIAGAMFGGLAEYSSMLLGFRYLLFVAVGLYVCSLIGLTKTYVATETQRHREKLA
jgi:SAM-dependent methyltransferase